MGIFYHRWSGFACYYNSALTVSNLGLCCTSIAKKRKAYHWILFSCSFHIVLLWHRIWLLRHYANFIGIHSKFGQRNVSFVLTITLPFGILFMMPAISMMLTSIGIITPAILITYRKYAFFILVCISALISPPDFLSQFVVLIPLVFIYEISILTAKFSYRKVVRSSVYESEHTDS